jgi:CheY-like chemotaxis protein
MPRILIADARRDRAAALASALAGWDCAVRFARDRASALEEAARFLPQAAVVGELPTGEALACALRALPGLGGVALIAVAGPDDPAPAGFDFLFREPVNLPDLQRVLAAARGGWAGEEAMSRPLDQFPAVHPEGTSPASPPGPRPSPTPDTKSV